MSQRDDLARAQLAHEQVEAIQRKADATLSAEYRTMVLKLPVLIHRQGLALALHFVAARGTGKTQVLQDLARHLEFPDQERLLKAVREAAPEQTRWLTAEAQRSLTWLKRMVQIRIEDRGEP